MKKRFLSITLTLALVLSTLVGTFVTAGAESNNGKHSCHPQKKGCNSIGL